MKQPITLILLGDIAAGKGTQARILAKKFRPKLVGTGTFSRKLWHKVRRVKLGKLTPSHIIQDYLKRELVNLPRGRGVLVDGGKMPAEASLVNKIFAKQGRRFLVIYLEIPRREIFKRLKIRIQKEKRADDLPKAIRNRMDYYKRIYSKTVKFWKQKGALRKVNGMGSVAEVTRRILKAIREYYK